MEDFALLLEWRNDETTRINSLHSGIVTPDEHALWLDSCLKDPGRSLLIIEEAGIPVGTLRIDCLQDGRKELSWAIAPKHRGTGIGKTAVRSIIEEHPNCVFVARIKKSNAASIRIAEYAGFRFQKEENEVRFFSTDV